MYARVCYCGGNDGCDDVSFIILILNELINVNHILFYTHYTKRTVVDLE